MRSICRRICALSSFLLSLGSIALVYPAQIPGRNAPDDGQWTMPAKDYASSRYSGLDQINTANVNGLKLAWSFPTGVSRGHEAAPLIVTLPRTPRRPASRVVIR